MTVITIRQEQMTCFRASAAERHSEEIRLFLGERYPAAVADLSRAAALERIQWGLRSIREVGVTDGRVAALFVVAQFVAGPSFYLHPSCASLFTDPRLPPNARVDALFHADAAIPWDEISRSRDDGVWLAGERERLAR